MKPGTWIVFAGFSVTIIEGVFGYEKAKKAALEKFGLEAKPYLAKRWIIRPPTEAELRQYAAMADGYRGSQPTAKTAPKPGKPVKKTVQERLL